MKIIVTFNDKTIEEYYATDYKVKEECLEILGERLAYGHKITYIPLTSIIKFEKE